MKKLGKLLISIVIVSLIVSMAIPLASAPKPDNPGGGGGKPPKDEPPADPAIAVTLGNNRINVMNDDGSNNEEVYSSEYNILGALSWSPDGSQLAFTQSYFELWVIDIAVIDGVPVGQNPTMLAGQGSCGGDDPISPAWSPSGDEIAVVTGLSHPAVWIVPTDGGTITELYSNSNAASINFVTWSSDSSQIAFVENQPNGGGSAIKIIEISTGTVTTALGATNNIGIYRIEWARTSDEIAYDTSPNDASNYEIYALDLDTSQTTKIVDGRSPTYSPDDSKIAYHGNTGRGYKTAVFTYDFTSGESTKLSNSGHWPDWSRDLST